MHLYNNALVIVSVLPSALEFFTMFLFRVNSRHLVCNFMDFGNFWNSGHLTLVIFLEFLKYY